jgi:hypothetical protein
MQLDENINFIQVQYLLQTLPVLFTSYFLDDNISVVLFSAVGNHQSIVLPFPLHKYVYWFRTTQKLIHYNSISILIALNLAGY